MDQEAQRDDLEEKLNNWKKRRNDALFDDDDKLFDEMQKKVEEAEAQLAAANLSLEKTANDFELERAAKETRELDEAVKAASAEFDTRSGERKQQFDGLKGTFDEKEADLQSNLTEIENLNGLIADAQNSGEDTTNLEADLATAEGETQGLRDARD